MVALNTSLYIIKTQFRISENNEYKQTLLKKKTERNGWNLTLN